MRFVTSGREIGREPTTAARSADGCIGFMSAEFGARLAPALRELEALRTVDFRAVDFRAVDFFAVDLRAVDLRAVDLRAVDFRAVDFFAVDLRAVDFFAVDFRAVDFAVDFRAVDFAALARFAAVLREPVFLVAMACPR